MGLCLDKLYANPVDTGFFKYNVDIDIKLKDIYGNVYELEQVKFKLKPAVTSQYKHQLTLGCSQAVLPGQDPRDQYNKECQDSCCVIEAEGVFLFAVFDGHGKVGKAVSQFCVDYITQEFPTRVEKFKQEPEIALKELVVETDEKLQQESTIDSSVSGTTAVVVYFDFKNYYVGNVGDSRAVLGKTANPGQLKDEEVKKIKQRGHNLLEGQILTYDHKPSNESEKERIVAHGGEVMPIKNGRGDFVGPPRVWKLNCEYPGLAMSRSVGDKVGKEVGVIAEPDVKVFPHDAQADQFMILGSDGVWDAVDAVEAVNFVEKHREKCGKYSLDRTNMAIARPGNIPVAQLVAEYARKNWLGIICEDDVIIDDIGCVVIEFNQKEVPEMEIQESTPSIPDSSTPAPPRPPSDSSNPGDVKQDNVRGSVAGRNPPNLNPKSPRQDPMRGSVARPKD